MSVGDPRLGGEKPSSGRTDRNRSVVYSIYVVER
jgi:hypothetical protein